MNKEEYENYQAQEALQNQNIEGQRITGMYPQQSYEQIQQGQAILVEQTNPSRVVEDILLRLKGKTKDSNGNLIKFSEPKMNDKGISDIWFILESIVNDNARLTNLEPQNISKMMEQISDDLVDMLTLNWKIYGIKRKTDLDFINNCVLMNVFFILNRAKGQNEKNWLGRISFENLSNNATKIPNYNSGSGGGSFLSKIKL